jgi:hypothetical protein
MAATVGRDVTAWPYGARGLSARLSLRRTGEPVVEWIAFGLVVWWWCSRRSRAQARRAERAFAVARTQQILQAGDGPLTMPALLIAVSEGYAYWRVDGRLVRAPWANGVADVDLVEPADPLLCDDLSGAAVVEILQALDDAEAQMRRVGEAGLR